MIFTLYRFFDADNVLLYVGLTVNPGRRMEKHKGTQPWWADVAQITMEQHPDIAALRAAEREAIETEKPLHNLRFNGTAPSPGSLTWICEECNQPIADGTGYVTVSYHDISRYEEGRQAFDAQHRLSNGWVAYTLNELDDYPDIARWRLLHQACDPHPDSNDYWYAIERLRTFPDILERTAHLTGKSWFQSTNWRDVLRQAAR